MNKPYEFHGHTIKRNISSEYHSWYNMKTRCLNKNHVRYKDYGGRGITVCQRWIDSFKDFLSDMGSKPSPEYSIDRFPDVNGNYEPSNCRWALASEQNKNTRVVTKVFLNGEERTIIDLAAEFNIQPKTLKKRIFILGWSVNDAIKTTTCRFKKHYKMKLING